MRNFVIALIAINLVYFGWNFAIDENPANTAGSTRNSGAESAIPGIRLLSELRDSERQSLQQRAASRAAQSSGVSCLRVGLFARKEDALAFVDLAQQLGLRADLEQAGGSGSTQYALVLPPFSSPSIAEIMSVELKNKLALDVNLLDSVIITSGSGQNGLRIGRFEHQSEARNWQAKVQALNFNAQLVEVPRLENRIRVIIQAQKQGELGEELWLSLSTYWVDLRKIEILC